MSRRPERREPRFEDDPRGTGDLRLTRADRPGGRAPAEPPPASARRVRTPRRRGRSLFGRLVYWSLVLAVWAVIGLAGLFAYYAMKLPAIDQLAVPKRPPNVAILASDGSLIANRGEMGGSAVPIGELPPYVGQAFIAIEDRRFLEHYGIDPVGLVRALTRNLASRRLEQGGSTLTQQLAKNLFLTQDRTLSRKVQEAMLALWLERKFSKQEILELYLNRVYFGAGAYGIEAASQRYFGKSARALTLGESAMLAGLVRSPSRLAPNRNPKGAAERGALVLAEMVAQGYASAQQGAAARAEPIDASRTARPRPGQYLADWVMDILDDHVGAIDSDIVVRTTIDPALQALAEKALAGTLDAKGGKAEVEQGALVALTPEGGVKAMIGGRDYASSQFNRAVSARRQPGSAFKPFVYLAALEKGLTPETIREDAPVQLRGWQPENYRRNYQGPVTLQAALAQSLNTVAVRLALEVGPKTVARTAQRLGINAPLQANPTIALGTSEVSPLEMAAAYAAFANGGTGVVPYAILKVEKADGTLIYERSAASLGPVIAPELVGPMNRMLRAVVTQGTARGAEIPGQTAAGKTGTTQDNKDAWFVGYTGHLVAAVWLGNDDGSETNNVTGSTLPVEVWSKFMRPAHGRLPARPLPGLLDPPPAVPQESLPTAQHGRPAPPPPAPAPAPDGPSARERGLFSRLFDGG